MKYLLQSLILLFTLNQSAMAQKGFDIEKEITINVSAAQLWDMVGPGFIDVYKWSSNVDHAEGKGISSFEGAVCDERFCDVNVKGFSKISEKLVNYDEQSMNLAYTVQNGMPGFITLAKNDWTVVPVNANTSKLVMKGTFRSKGLMGTLMNGVMKKKMAETLETVLNDAKVFAETGEISIAKKERNQELAKKKRAA